MGLKENKVNRRTLEKINKQHNILYKLEAQNKTKKPKKKKKT